MDIPWYTCQFHQRKSGSKLVCVGQEAGRWQLNSSMSSSSTGSLAQVSEYSRCWKIVVFWHLLHAAENLKKTIKLRLRFVHKLFAQISNPNFMCVCVCMVYMFSNIWVLPMIPMAFIGAILAINWRQTRCYRAAASSKLKAHWLAESLAPSPMLVANCFALLPARPGRGGHNAPTWWIMVGRMGGGRVIVNWERPHQGSIFPSLNTLTGEPIFNTT